MYSLTLCSLFLVKCFNSFTNTNTKTKPPRRINTNLFTYKNGCEYSNLERIVSGSEYFYSKLRGSKLSKNVYNYGFPESMRWTLINWVNSITKYVIIISPNKITGTLIPINALDVTIVIFLVNSDMLDKDPNRR